MEQIALDTYKEATTEINALATRIETLVKLRYTAIANVSSLLNRVLLENNMLSNIVWKYHFITVDQNYIVFNAYKDHTRDTLLSFLDVKKGTYADYDLKRTEDNDHVILTLSITPSQEQLYIDRDHISSIIKEYHLVNIFTPSIDIHITAANDLIEVLSVILIAVQDERFTDYKGDSP